MKILRQRNIPILGALVDSFVTSLPLTSLITFVSMQIVLYDTSVRPYLDERLPWLSVWIFVSLIVLAIAFVMLLVFKYILPSIWRYRYGLMGSREKEILEHLDNLVTRIEKLENKDES